MYPGTRERRNGAPPLRDPAARGHGPHPAPRGTIAIAYDPGRDRTVLFGGRLIGRAGDVVSSETWEWDGARWSRLDVKGPSARSHAEMVYDSGAKRVLLFGGRGAAGDGCDLEGCCGDTWAWDGASWERLSAAGPARAFHALAYDARRERTVLVGGTDSCLAQLPSQGAGTVVWEWDRTSWSPVAGNGRAPHDLIGAAMAYDAGSERVVLLGGIWLAAPADDLGPARYEGDDTTWTFDGVSWASAGPGPTRTDASMTATPEGLVLAGGYEALTTVHCAPDGLCTDTWRWSRGAWTKTSTGGLTVQLRRPMTYDAARGRVLLYGSTEGTCCEGGTCQVTWQWDGTRWASQ